MEKKQSMMGLVSKFWVNLESVQDSGRAKGRNADDKYNLKCLELRWLFDDKECIYPDTNKLINIIVRVIQNFMCFFFDEKAEII